MKRKSMEILSLASRRMLLLALLSLPMLLVTAGCQKKQVAASQHETVTITSLNGSRQAVPVEVPLNPQRVAVLDMAALDILDKLGLGDRVVGCAATSLEYLEKYPQRQGMANLGTIKTADMEAVMECRPQLIFIGGRLASSYDDLSRIAPVVYLQTDSQLGVFESVKANAATIATIFGLQDRATQLMDGFRSRIDALSQESQGKTALIALCTNGGLNILGDQGRCSIIGREIGFANLGNGYAAEREAAKAARSTAANSSHGNEISFEYIMANDPDYLFVLDRDAAIGTNGAKLARDIVENELIMDTTVYRNGNIVYLNHPGIWYTAEGGITALDYMLKDIESAILPE